MKIIRQSYEILSYPDNLEKTIEAAGRTCYQSQEKITYNSAEEFCGRMVKAGHHAMIEFGNIIVRFITNRGVTHELVRHRLASFAQESTRYVKYGEDMEFIEPVWIGNIPQDQQLMFVNMLETSAKNYTDLLDQGRKPQEAREVLPNALKTEIVVNTNVREWRHIFTLRCSKAAHPQIRELMIPVRDDFAKRWPSLFGDLKKEIQDDRD